ncbi:MAG: hypothetical protein ACR2HM_10745 [Acidimicrobiales bacterium]
MGPGGRLALLDRCKDGTSRIRVGRIAAAGGIEGLRNLALSRPLLVKYLRWSADGQRLWAAEFTPTAGPDQPVGSIVSIDVSNGQVNKRFAVDGAIDAAELVGAIAVATRSRVSVHHTGTGAEIGSVAGGGALAVSPDRSIVAVEAGSIDLLTASGDVSTLVEQSGRAQYLIYSPDGTVLVAVSEGPDGSEALVITTTTGGAQRVVARGGDLSRPALSSDAPSSPTTRAAWSPTS